MSDAARTPAASAGILYKVASIAGFVAIALWLVWWGLALYRLELPFCAQTWIRYPFFGADFTTQSDYAARLFAGGNDPYSFRDHLFHYPPIVIRLFLWTPFFSNPTALQIWVVVLIALIVLGTWAALVVRRELELERVPASVAIAAVLYSFATIFTLERSNFDLITLAVMLLAFWLLRRKDPRAAFIAGCLLAVGPWVKLYPGIMGLGLLALRQWRALAGFIVAGLVIGAAAPAETLDSFETLHIAVDRIKRMSLLTPYATWSHSLSVAWLKLGQALASTPLGPLVQAIPADVAAGLQVLLLSGIVCFRLYRLQASPVLLYPLLLWLNAVGSCVGAIANDYSLMFLPLAIVAVFSLRDPWFTRVSIALLLVWWQPVHLNIPAVALLMIKVLALIATGVSIVQRAKELAGAAVNEPVNEPEAPAAPALAP